MTFKPFSSFSTENIDSNHQFLEFHEFVHTKHEKLVGFGRPRTGSQPILGQSYTGSRHFWGS